MSDGSSRPGPKSFLRSKKLVEVVDVVVVEVVVVVLKVVVVAVVKAD